MFYRIIFYFTTLLIAIILLPERNAFAQHCIGNTAYIVRNEKGKVMNLQETEKLVVKVEGVVVAPKHLTASLPSAFLPDQKEFKEANPLVFFGFIPEGAKGVLGYCGKIGEAVIIYGGKQMRLLFDINKHNTSYVIDSLPFQEGTFHLRSLKCAYGAPPPMIDNNTTGKCLVSADNWEGMEKEWVRRLNPTYYWYVSIKNPGNLCHNKSIEVITTKADWDAKWSLYPDIHSYSQGIDFRTQMVLTSYGTHPGHNSDSFVVDKKGNLTVRLAPGINDPRVCNVYFLLFYRSGVNSIEGKPLAPAPKQ